MRPAPDPAGHRVPRTKPTCLLHTWRPHRRRPSALVLHLHQHQSSHNLHLQYLAKNQSTQRCQSLITQGSDHPPVLEPHMVLILPSIFDDFSKFSDNCVATDRTSERFFDGNSILREVRMMACVGRHVASCSKFVTPTPPRLRCEDLRA
jgi:hypothetical protein